MIKSTKLSSFFTPICSFMTIEFRWKHFNHDHELLLDSHSQYNGLGCGQNNFVATCKTVITLMSNTKKTLPNCFRFFLCFFLKAAIFLSKHILNLCYLYVRSWTRLKMFVLLFEWCKEHLKKIWEHYFMYNPNHLK